MAATQLTRGGGLQLAVVFFLVAGATAEVRTGSASWSGAPDGAGNQDGGCGFGDTVAAPPYSAMVTGFGHNDDDCGVCYKVTCTGHPACSAQGVNVTVSDSCRSALCAEPNNQHFDLAGHAFGAMAKPGRADDLRAARNVTVDFEAVDCHYTRPSSLPPNAVFPFFKVDPSATKDNFSVTLLYTEGWASWKEVTVYLLNIGEKTSYGMQHTYGATWKYVGGHDGPTVSPPMSMMVYTSSLSNPHAPMKKVSMANVIPVGWQPGKIYYRPL